MTTYLVDELGCAVNECDADGRSPLYFAVRCKSLEMIQFLLNHGARNDLMNAIKPCCALLESIDAEELLGSSFICDENGICDLERSFEHFCRAIELRSTHNLPKALRESTSEVFDNRQECQTIDQLKELRSSSDNMHNEVLLVRERLFSSINAKYHYPLTYHGAILADNAQYYREIALWLYELDLHQQYSNAIDPKYLRQFPSIFSEMVTKSLLILMEAILTVMTVTVGELKHNTKQFDENLYNVLF
jgi:hypothetical protein